MPDDADIDVFARTIWGEARSDGREGMEAVASVVMNRVNNPRWWGDTITSVVLMPWQFSPWNKGDPNLKKMKNVTRDDPEFRLALEIAETAASGELIDRTNNADHFHTPKAHPTWSRGRHPVAIVGGHLFFRLELKAPPAPPTIAERPAEQPAPQEE